MAKFYVDGIEYEAEAGENLLHAVLSQSLDLPYFCWHPAMGSIGACRQCAIIQYADEEDTRGRLTMACMTPVAEDLRISVEAPQAKDFRSGVIEWLMENHPHDCPVCEEGGECHLQDMTVMTGHSMRRYRNQKRTWRNQDLGPFIGHEMNRCITCYRCVRFYGDYAGGTDLAALGSKSHVYFGRVTDGTLESEFSGNLVEVCPTGVFTDKPFAKHYTRKWDLQSAPSICPGCSVGCNTFASERYGLLKRLHNRYNGEVNRYFLCDRGRFGSHFVNSQNRIRFAGNKASDGSYEYGYSAVVVDAAAQHLDGAIGIGSPRASVETNFALKQLVGAENFCTGMSDVDEDLLKEILSIRNHGGFHSPTPSEIESADAILILGEDISNTAARIALSVRQAVRGVSFDMADSANIPLWQDAGVRGHAQHAHNPLFIAVNSTTRLDDIATASCNGSTKTLAHIGFNIAAHIDGNFAGEAESDFAKTVAETLKSAKNPLIISGIGSQSKEMLQAAANIAWALRNEDLVPSLLYVLREANSMGSAMVGGSLSMSDALTRMQQGANAIIAENDLYRRADAGTVDSALEGTGSVLCLDSLSNRTAEKSEFAFPAATYAEQTGTFVNLEGRAQRFYQVFQPADEIRPSWKWIADLAASNGRPEATWASLEELSGAVNEESSIELPALQTGNGSDHEDISVPRQTHRYSGRTAMYADQTVHEPKTAIDPETPLSYSMEGVNQEDQNGATIPYVWTPGWNSNQSVFKFQAEVGGPLKGGDPGSLLDTVDPQGPNHAHELFRSMPTPETGNGQLITSASYHIFGSEELSSSSWPVAQRSTGPFVRIHSADAERLGAKNGNGVFSPEKPEQKYEVIVDDNVARGTVGIGVGFATNDYHTQTQITLQVDPEYQPRPTGEDRILAKD